MRTATIKRKTKETDIEVTVNLDGTGVSNVATGIGFFDHMLDLLARHSRIDIEVKADGDLHVDHHHTTEDVGIALGQAVKQALGTMAGITRYASIHMPMDETLSRAGRCWCSRLNSRATRWGPSIPSWCANGSMRSPSTPA
jgi:imidazoleglycerol-phosphate dehydratase